METDKERKTRKNEQYRSRVNEAISTWNEKELSERQSVQEILIRFASLISFLGRAKCLTQAILPDSGLW